MLENESMATQVSKETKNIQGIRTVPDPEVREKAVRRKFTAERKPMFDSDRHVFMALPL